VLFFLAVQLLCGILLDWSFGKWVSYVLIDANCLQFREVFEVTYTTRERHVEVTVEVL
jgi:hypothetical protein